MSAAWVAGSTRARALVRRRLGSAGAGRIGASASVSEAVEALADTSYGHDVRSWHSLAEAQHAVLATLLWHLRVLAGWLPRDGVQTIRVLARWFEIANVDELLNGAAGGIPDPEFALGGMATVWPRLRPGASASEIRGVLTTSPWGDPGGEDRRRIQLGMRLSWAAQVAAAAKEAEPWALGGAALLVATERHAEGRELGSRLTGRAEALLGERAPAASSIQEMAETLPAAARWALADVTDSSDLWAAEERWWARVERDGLALLTGAGFAPGPVIGAVAVLAADARRVRAALESAARGGTGHELA